MLNSSVAKLFYLSLIFATVIPKPAYAQTINNYQDFKIYCSKEARYFDAESPDCNRYIQDQRQKSRLATNQNLSRGNINYCMQLTLFLRQYPQAQPQNLSRMQQCMQLMIASTQLSSSSLTPSNPTSETVSPQIELPIGTKVRLELAMPLNSKTAQQGDEVGYFVSEDVVTKYGEVFIQRGARATGEVTKVQRSKTLGRKGMLEFTVDEVEAVDGTKIPLRSTVNRDGKSRGGTVAVLSGFASPLFPFFLLIKGKNIYLGEGTPIRAYTDRATSIEVALP